MCGHVATSSKHDRLYMNMTWLPQFIESRAPRVFRPSQLLSLSIQHFGDAPFMSSEMPIPSFLFTSCSPTLTDSARRVARRPTSSRLGGRSVRTWLHSSAEEHVLAALAAEAERFQSAVAETGGEGGAIRRCRTCMRT